MNENVLHNNDVPARVSAGREEQLLGRKPLLLPVTVWVNHRYRENMHTLQQGKHNVVFMQPD